MNSEKKIPKFWQKHNLITWAPLTGSEKLLLYVLYNACGDREGNACWRNQQELAEACGWKTRNLRNVLSSLEKRNLISRQRRGKRLTNHYQILWKRLQELIEGGDVSQTENKQSRERHSGAGVTGTPVPGERHAGADPYFNRPINNPKNKESKRNSDELVRKGDFPEPERWRPRLANGEFKSLTRGVSRFSEARQLGVVSPEDELRFLTLWRHCGAKHEAGSIDRPGGLFIKLLHEKKWQGSQTDEDAVYQFLRESQEVVPVETNAGLLKESALAINSSLIKGCGDD